MFNQRSHEPLGMDVSLIYFALCQQMRRLDSLRKFRTAEGILIPCIPWVNLFISKNPIPSLIKERWNKTKVENMLEMFCGLMTSSNCCGFCSKLEVLTLIYGQIQCTSILNLCIHCTFTNCCFICITVSNKCDL